MFITTKNVRALLAFKHYGNEFRFEATARESTSSAGLRAQSELVLFIASELVLLRQHLGGFPHHHFGQRAEKPITVHAVH